MLTKQSSSAKFFSFTLLKMKFSVAAIVALFAVGSATYTHQSATPSPSVSPAPETKAKGVTIGIGELTGSATGNTAVSVGATEDAGVAGAVGGSSAIAGAGPGLAIGAAASSPSL